MDHDIYLQGTWRPVTFVKSTDPAVPPVMLIMFVLNVVSGTCFPDSPLPSWLRDVAQALAM